MKGPVIILGTVRTGSSTLLQALRSIGYPRHNEGHLFSLFHLIDEQIVSYFADPDRQSWNKTLFSSVSSQELRRIIRDSEKKLVEAIYGTDKFVEKTVNLASLLALHIIYEIWPSTAGFFTLRRPLEAIRSRLIKFPVASLESHIDDIKDIHRLWLAMRAQYPGIIEIEHRDLVSNIPGLAAKIGRHLELDTAKQAELASALSSLKVEKSSASYSPISIDDLNLDAKKRELLINELGFIFEEYGYSYDCRYFSQI